MGTSNACVIMVIDVRAYCSESPCSLPEEGNAKGFSQQEGKAAAIRIFIYLSRYDSKLALHVDSVLIRSAQACGLADLPDHPSARIRRKRVCFFNDLQRPNLLRRAAIPGDACHTHLNDLIGCFRTCALCRSIQ